MGDCLNRCHSSYKQPSFQEQLQLQSKIDYVRIPDDANMIKQSKDSKESEGEQLMEDLPSVLGSQSTSTNRLNGMSIKLFVFKPSNIVNSSLIRRLDNVSTIDKDSHIWVQPRFNSSTFRPKQSLGPQ